MQEKPHKCPHCQKQFSRKDALNRHLSVKSGCQYRRRSQAGAVAAAVAPGHGQQFVNTSALPVSSSSGGGGGGGGMYGTPPSPRMEYQPYTVGLAGGSPVTRSYQPSMGLGAHATVSGGPGMMYGPPEYWDGAGPYGETAPPAKPVGLTYAAPSGPPSFLGMGGATGDSGAPGSMVSTSVGASASASASAHANASARARAATVPGPPMPSTADLWSSSLVPSHHPHHGSVNFGPPPPDMPVGMHMSFLPSLPQHRLPAQHPNQADDHMPPLWR